MDTFSAKQLIIIGFDKYYARMLELEGLASVYRLRAQPKASKPGPKLAVVAGTRIVTRFISKSPVKILKCRIQNAKCKIVA